MRRSVLPVPVADGGLGSVRSGGVWWICGFTDTDPGDDGTVWLSTVTERNGHTVTVDRAEDGL